MFSDTKHKEDDGKLRWDTIPFRQLDGVLRILTNGVKKYGKESWKRIDQPQLRFANALLRHMSEYMQGRKYDKESGENHMLHIICNALFLAEFDADEKALDEAGMLFKKGDSEGKYWDLALDTKVCCRNCKFMETKPKTDGPGFDRICVKYWHTILNPIADIICKAYERKTLEEKANERC